MAKSVLIFGHAGLLGHSLVTLLSDLLYVVNFVSRNDCDLRDRQSVDRVIGKVNPDIVINAAGVVGGIGDNLLRPAKYLYDNLLIQANVVDSVLHSSVAQYLTFGSSCMYPKDAPIPYRVQDLYSGSPEISNLPYALSKLSTVELIRAYNQQYSKRFLCLVPTNIYGPYDKFFSEKSHVIPALITKMHHAKIQSEPAITLWGSGLPQREFLYVDDLALATVKLLNTKNVSNNPINVGSSVETSIADLADLIANVVNYSGEILFDKTKPDGSPRKLLDSSYIHSLGWQPSFSLFQGLSLTYRHFLNTPNPYVA